jgi:protoheme IX farnesyltransferase
VLKTAELSADRAGASAYLRDLLELAKPRITGMVIFTFAGGLFLAPGAVAVGRALVALLGTTLIVAAANAINMYLERDRDGLMSRTRRRPLPEGRLAPFVALAFGAMVASAAIPLLLVGGGFLLAALGIVAFYAYVWAYTPLKRRTPAALYVGAIPGAMPPLMGWAAATGRLDAAGLTLFAVLFLWQIPHFIAIATFRSDEYANAGFKVMSLERSPWLTKLTVVLSSLALVAATLLLVGLGVAGRLFGVAAALLGAGFVALGARVLGQTPGSPASHRWARSLFGYSLLYLTALFVALAIDRQL